jgi:hypothetical protein
MLNKKHRLLIKKAKKEYKKIGFVKCPAFNNERVYFTRHGFHHLIRKGKRLRKIDEQIKRLGLLKYAPLIISSSKGFKDFNKNKELNNEKIKKSADFWSLSQIFNKIEIIVVIRQIKGSNKHFFSIMKR